MPRMSGHFLALASLIPLLRTSSAWTLEKAVTLEVPTVPPETPWAMGKMDEAV